MNIGANTSRVPKGVVLLIDQSETSRKMVQLFQAKGIPHQVSIAYFRGRSVYRPAVTFRDDDGAHLIEGAEQIEAEFLHTYSPDPMLP